MSVQEENNVAVASASMPFVQNRETLSQLFSEHHRRVLLAAYRITGSMADAEDVTQAVFLRLASAGAETDNPGAYLYRAAINGALDLLRRRKTWAAVPIDNAAEVSEKCVSPEQQASSLQLGEILRQAIGELSPRAAEMFTLRHIEGMGNREIADLMRTSQAVVAVTVHQARAKLKKKLRQSGWEQA